MHYYVDYAHIIVIHIILGAVCIVRMYRVDGLLRAICSLLYISCVSVCIHDSWYWYCTYVYSTVRLCSSFQHWTALRSPTLAFETGISHANGCLNGLNEDDSTIWYFKRSKENNIRHSVRYLQRAKTLAKQIILFFGVKSVLKVTKSPHKIESSFCVSGCSWRDLQKCPAIHA